MNRDFGFLVFGFFWFFGSWVLWYFLTCLPPSPHEDGMKSLLLWLLICCLPYPVLAQPDSLWSRTYLHGATTSCYAMERTPDNGYILGGICAYDGMFLLKVDENGDSLWCHRYMRGSETHMYSVHRTLDGGYVLAGYAILPTEGFVYLLLKSDSNGDSLWARTYQASQSASRCYAAIQTSDGGYALAGILPRDDDAHLYERVWLVKTNALGDSLWSRTYALSQFASGDVIECRTVYQTTDGGYILGVKSTVAGSGVLRTNSVGDSLFTKWHFHDASLNFSITPTRDGGYFFAGRYGADHGPGWKWWRCDANLDTLWSGILVRGSMAVSSEAYASIETMDGGFIVAGCDSGRYCLIRLNQQGNRLWTRHYGQNYCAAWAMQPTPQGGFAMGGYVYHGGDSERYPMLLITGPDTYQSYTESSPAVQTQYYLFANYPNPFNPETRISFDLPQSGPTQLQIFDINGRIVTTLLTGMTSAGHHDLAFNGAMLPSGVYFYHLQSGNYSATRKMLLLK
jgi:hypothetical protein